MVPYLLRRLLVAGIALAMMTSTSCTTTVTGSATSAGSSTPSAAAPSAAATTKPPANVNEGTFKIGDVVKFDGELVGKVTKIQDVVATGGGLPADSGKRYVAVDIAVTNSGADPVYFTPLLQAELKDPEGTVYDAWPASGHQPEAPNGEVKAQQTLSGAVVFEIPAKYRFDSGTAAGFAFVFRGGVGGDGKVEIKLG